MTHNELEKLRDLAGKLGKGELQNLIQSLQYSPPVRPEGYKERKEPFISPIITGIRFGQQAEHLTGGASGEGQGGSGSAVGEPTGQART